MAIFPLLLSLTVILLSSQIGFAQNSTILFPSNSTLHWVNAESSGIQTYKLPSGLIVRAVLLTNATTEIYGNSFIFALAFYCNRRITDKCLLSVLLMEATNGAVRTNRPVQGVWVGHRDMPVRDNATLRAEPGKGLTLADSDGLEVWSTNMSGDPISGMTLRSDGNLVLFSSSHSTAWSSFENPANTLVMGQALNENQKLRSGVSNVNSITGKFYLSINSDSSLTAFVDYENPVAYISVLPFRNVPKNAKLRHVEFHSRSLKFVYELGNEYLDRYRNVTQASTIQLLRLDWDGGLRVYVWEQVSGWTGIDVWLKGYDECQYPLLCGKYGVCTGGGCTCPTASDGVEYFTPIYRNSPERGCRYAHTLDLKSTTDAYLLVEFGNLSYFSYFDPNAPTVGLTELGTCQRECEGNSTCRAVFFMYGRNASDGLCYLLTDVLTIKVEPASGSMNSSVSLIKVPNISVPSSPAPSIQPRSSPPAQDGKGESTRFSSVGRTLAIVIPISLCVIISWTLLWWKIKRRCPVTDCYEQVLGAPMRFSYKELCIATRKFSMRLGRGGFGTVFKGELKHGTPIAVKKLDCIEQGMCEFLAEMKTMGSINHVNLVKLHGFCADKSNRMLVYEYMSNNSLDKWIFARDGREVLSWETRRRIILDVARGLAYLHEECSQRIAHLDMKPHNILLDENFNAKISDFGLARFIDRNQSHVVTGMRGTLGYLAPEWQHSRITVKVDVYSFGIVVLEAVSGRMNLDFSQQDSDINLLRVLQRKASQGRLIDIVDEKIEDSEYHVEDMLLMIKIGAWCLNEDPCKRPSMSTVVKVLEGTLEIEQDIDFKFAHVLVLTCKSSSKIISI